MGNHNAIYKDDFVFNTDEFKGAEILVAGDNFGCGSSREHAPWSVGALDILAIRTIQVSQVSY